MLLVLGNKGDFDALDARELRTEQRVKATGPETESGYLRPSQNSILVALQGLKALLYRNAASAQCAHCDDLLYIPVNTFQRLISSPTRPLFQLPNE